MKKGTTKCSYQPNIKRRNNMKKLVNLELLKKDLEKNNWGMDGFQFTYKKVEFYVLVKLYLDNEIKQGNVLVKLEFIKKLDLNDRLIAPATTSRLLVDTKKMRNYFHIEIGRAHV